MDVTLNPRDLDPKYLRKVGDNVEMAISISEVTFDKLTPVAQAVVRAAGRATFFSWDRRTHTVVFAPK